MATFTAGELVWKITGDSSGLNKSLGQAEAQTKKSGSVISSTAKGIGVAVLAGFSIDAIVQFGKSLIKSASDASETAQKFGVVFNGIQETANETAREVANSYNISVNASKELLSSTGNVLQSFGYTKTESLKLSASITGLAADLTSFTNYAGGTAEASRILTKALLGERDALDSLGIKVTENELQQMAKAEGKVYQNLSAVEKAQITYNAILDKSKNAIGDTARSSDTYAYSVRRVQKAQEDFAAQAGSSLTPIMKTLNNLWSSILESWSKPIAIAQATGIEKFSLQIDDLNSKIEANKKEIKYLTENNQAPGLVKALQQNIEIYQKEIDALTESIKKLKEEEAKKPKPKEEIKKDPAIIAAEQDRKKQLEKERKDRLDGRKQTNIDLLNAEADYYKQLNQVSDIAATDYLMNLKNQQSAELEALKETLKLEGEARLEAGTATQAQLDALAEFSINKLLQSQQKQTSDYVAGMEKQEEATISFSEQVQKISEVFNVVFDSVSSVLSAIDNLQQANYDKESDRLDEQMNAEIAAANATEETAVEKAQKEYDLAVSSGNNDTIIEKKKALDRIKIEEDYAKKKRQLDYEAAVSAWDIQVALAAIQVAQAPLNAFASTMGINPNPVLAAGAAAAAAIAAGIQMAAVVAAKPQPPKFANGGIVPGTSFSGDKVNANVNSGEMILNADQQKKLFDIANGATGGSQIVLNNYIGTEKIGTVLYKMSTSGELILDSRAVR